MARVSRMYGPALVFLLGIALSLWASFWLKQNIDSRAEARLKLMAQVAADEVSEHFVRSGYGLLGARGMFAAFPAAGRQDFLAYVASRDISVEFPGVPGFGIIERVQRRDLPAYLKKMQADGVPDFAVHTLENGAMHADLFLVRQIEPRSANWGALGLDLGSEPVQRSALETAVDTGQMTITAPLGQVQAKGQGESVLVLVPFYRGGVVPATVGARRQSLLGILYAPIVISQMVAQVPAIRSEQLRIKILDGAANGQPGRVLYSSPTEAGGQAAVYTTNAEIRIPGRVLTLQASSTPLFEQAIDQHAPWSVFAAGGLVSLLLSLLLLEYANARRKAEKLAEQMTREIEWEKQRAQDFSRSSSDWFWETDSQHHFVYFSDNFESVYGLPTAVLLGRKRQDLLERETLNSPADLAAYVEKINRHQPFKDFEYCVHDSQGQLRWVSVSGIPIRDPAGGFAGYRGSGAIITDRKLAEQNVAAEKARLAALLETASDGIHIVDQAGNLAQFSRSFALMLGYAPEEIAGQHVSFWDVAIAPGEVGHWLKSIVTAPQTFETRHRHKDGHILDVEINAKGIDVAGVVYLYASSRDITARKKAEVELEGYRKHLETLVDDRTAALLIAKEEAEAASLAKSAFLATMSHELRTPIHGISGMASLASRRATDPKQAEQLIKLKQSSDHLLGLITDILEYASADADRLMLANTPFTLDEVLGQLTTTVSGAAHKKGLDFNVVCPPALMAVAFLGDPVRIRQILLNLTQNALAFTAQGKVEIRVHQEQQHGASLRLRFEVEDTGQGILKEDQPHIFKAFEQADMSLSRSHGGIGLGLALCRQLVRKMGGEIGFQSAPGAGSTFWFTVQVEAATAATAPLAVELGSSLTTSLAEAFPGASILLATADPQTLENFRGTLEQAGMDLFVATNAGDAVEVMASAIFHLIVLDAGSPEINAVEVAYAIRASKGNGHTPIIGLAADTHSAEWDACIHAGMNDRLAPNASAAEICRGVQKWLALGDESVKLNRQH